MTIFGTACRVIPNLAGNTFATAHFRLHEPRVLATLVTLPLVITGNAGLAPVLVAAEVAIIRGIIAWAINVIRTIA